MKRAGTLQLTTPGERDLVMTRSFDAPRTLVFDAHTKPELVRRWLLGPPGWSMPVCEIDLRVGGKYRYVWQHDRDGTKMGMGGVYREIKAPERIVNTEKFDEAWYPGEAVGTLVLVEQGGTTTLTHTMRYESRAARDAVIKSNMESGVDELWKKLLAGGREDQCGWLQDKYGLSWQIIPTVLGKMLGDKDPEKATRVMQAMLQMKKIDIKALQQAYDRK